MQNTPPPSFFSNWTASVDRTSVCCLVLPIGQVPGSRVLGIICHLPKSLVLELLCWGSRVTPCVWEDPGSWDAEDGLDGFEVWALDGWGAWHLSSLLGFQIVPEEEEQDPDTQGPRGKAEA